MCVGKSGFTCNERKVLTDLAKVNLALLEQAARARGPPQKISHPHPPAPVGRNHTPECSARRTSRLVQADGPVGRTLGPSSP